MIAACKRDVHAFEQDCPYHGLGLEHVDMTGATAAAAPIAAAAVFTAVFALPAPASTLAASPSFAASSSANVGCRNSGREAKKVESERKLQCASCTNGPFYSDVPLYK